MKKADSSIITWLLLLTLISFAACNGQEDASSKIQVSKEPPTVPNTPPGPEIAGYVRNIFQDKNGGYWFGTNGYGVAHYDGERVAYYSNAQGFGGQQITGIAEDQEQNIWFATDQGLVKYGWSSDEEGEKRFTNYSGWQFGDQRFWSVTADSKGNVWGGTVKGVYRFDGITWKPFKLPYPEEVKGDFITKATTWSILEDREGNMWFSTNGYGAFKYDGQSFTQYTEEDGLTDNHVDQILEDSKGNIWFGTRFGGVSRFDGEQFVNYSQRDGIIGNDEVCVIFEDKAGNIWFSSEGYGVYRYDGESFTNFSEAQGLMVRAVQTIYEDAAGQLWAGGGGGLYRYDGESFVNVTREGPW
ncbi:MAG: two-component regulator propeller domain-containing protein [Bacteroidota bacterium]